MGTASSGEWIAILLYFALVIGVGVYFFIRDRHVEGEKEYFLGGRSMGGWVAALSAGASDMSAWVLMGLPGSIYLYGIGKVWIAVGLVIGTICAWVFVAPRLRRYSIRANDSITIPQFLTNRFQSKNKGLQIISAIVFVVVYCVYSASSISACGTLFNTVTGMSAKTAMIIATAIITIMPLAFATMIEHIGDISAIGSTCERNYIADPGLHRTLLGDGLATILASLFGAPANTTYGENTGVLALTRVFDPRVIRIAACCAIVLSFCPKFAAVIAAMPACVIGGVSLVLYGMISAVGVRNLIENQVDFQNNRNVLVAALVLVLSLGIAYSTAGAIVLELGGVTISLSGLAVGSLVGIVLNAILPGKDYTFEQDDQGATSVDFKV